MAGAASTGCTFFPATAFPSSSSSSSSSSLRKQSYLFLKPIHSSIPRLVAFSQSKLSSSRRCRPHRLAALAGFGEDSNSETYPDAEPSNSNSVASIDTKLPRRSLLVQFTCVGCGGRTQRLINRLAYEKGTVYVQCAGCQKYHKLVDNLGLVIEYDLREETTDEIDTDQVP
ncbi:Zim17-type zinc finger protein [Euphorbia peplus]|nr:Zim17-type zinc finger protein [Euphorbia peplus]